jgi:homoserine dehydrogenase
LQKIPPLDLKPFATLNNINKEDELMKKIGVLGTGTMGAGIIQVLAQNGYEVVLRARRQTSVDGGIAKVTKAFDKMFAKEKMTEEQKNEIMSRIEGSTDISIVKDADLIIEAATEDMEAKKALFAELNELVKPMYPGYEHIITVNHRDRRCFRKTGQSYRNALLQSCSDDEAR